ncbi:MAG: hypothetical protein JNJ77_19870 [Planctomycetia bacterium]|nr:hypothetical protein [Planctomycetia bacterium]
MNQTLEFNRYQIVGILPGGDELLVTLGCTETEVRMLYVQQVEQLRWIKLLGFSLREWVALQEGGYWRPIRFWKQTGSDKHADSAADRSPDTRRRAWADARGMDVEPG